MSEAVLWIMRVERLIEARTADPTPARQELADFSLCARTARQTAQRHREEVWARLGVLTEWAYAEFGPGTVPYQEHHHESH